MFGGCNSFGGAYGGGCGGCEVERGGGSTFCLIVVLFILLIIVGRTFCV